MLSTTLNLFSCLCTVGHQTSTSTSHNTMVKFSEKIVQSLSHEPKAIALRLLSAGFITERVLQETNELNEINADKATRLYTAVLSVVRDHPHKYHEFASILRTSQGVHVELMQELKSAILGGEHHSQPML